MRTLKMPANRVMKLAPDCWEAAIEKGIAPRAVVEGVLRTQLKAWLGNTSQAPAAPPVNTADPPLPESVFGGLN